MKYLPNISDFLVKSSQTNLWIENEEHLKALNMTSLEERFRRGNLIETFKIIKGKVNISPGQFFTSHHRSTSYNQSEESRGHQLKLKTRRSRTHARAKFFANRVVSAQAWMMEQAVSNSWETIMSQNTNTFKRTLEGL